MKKEVIELSKNMKVIQAFVEMLDETYNNIDMDYIAILSEQIGASLRILNELRNKL